MSLFRLFGLLAIGVLVTGPLKAQVVINEGSNRNYTSLADENGDYPDWIELYNSGTDTISLLNYALTDKMDNPAKWVLPNIMLAPGEFRVVFCSGKDRKPLSGFVNVVNTGPFIASEGWNTHELTTPFSWDGVSGILVNTCSYSSAGYTTNSVFNQTTTAYASTVFSFQDGSPGACSAGYGSLVYHRPDMKLNGVAIGSGNFQNSPYDYPAPYGNWYWGARNQMLIPASELVDAGLEAGDITSLAFDVVSTDPNTSYDYIEIYMKMTSAAAVSSAFENVDTNNFLHTNFRISGSGETIYLFGPDQSLLSELFVHCNDLDNSTGLFPDATAGVYLFQTATPCASNNNSDIFSGYLEAVNFSVPSGFYEDPESVIISNPNVGSTVHYTLDGSDPTTSSPAYSGIPVNISTSKVLKARAFTQGVLPGPLATATYLFDAWHSTPVLSVVTDDDNLYGPAGIFDNWQFDWERTAYVEYFDSTQQLVFSQRAGIQIDGGAGGSRSHPQHSFRVELADGVLGDGPVDYQLIPNRSARTKYSKFYLRNGSNQYLGFPYKDACQVELMAGKTHNYYSAWRPITVYINGEYFGLYELREKFDVEYFETLEDADPDSMDILTLSYWYGGSLRAVAGSVDSFLADYEAFSTLDPDNVAYWSQADHYFDLTWYTDYIIAQSWMGNNDWPWNNIKIYRSDKTDLRWRFCVIDQELAMEPNGWTDCYFDHIGYMLSQSSSIPYIHVWLKSIQNGLYRTYFINRFADIMNTAYHYDRLSSVEGNFYSLTIPEMYNEYSRWGDPGTIEEQMSGFIENHFIFLGQLELRTPLVRQHILSNFSLPNLVDLTLNVVPEGSGTIHISTIEPENYPWEGVYFNGVPVRIEAIPAEGFSFEHWQDNGLIADTMNSTFNNMLNTSETSFVAYFESITTSVSTGDDGSTGITAFPNPALDLLHLEGTGINEELEFRIIDMHGRIVKEGIASFVNGRSSIDIRSLPRSLYLLRMTGPDGKGKTFRFVKGDH